MNNYWINGMIGVAVADAFGSPVQFMNRESLKKNPLTEMEYCDIYDKPAGAIASVSVAANAKAPR